MNRLWLYRRDAHDYAIYSPALVYILVSSKNNATASYSMLKSEFRVGMSVFVLVCVIPLTTNLSSSILTHWIAAMKANKRTGSDRTYNLNSLSFQSMTRGILKDG